MNKKEVLVVEISGKRPGNKKQRPTEKYNINYDHLIISNNSTDYETEWKIVNVPKDYEEYYKNNFKHSENAWYAPMNRSYAIKYAREHGYKYLIQLDDNIQLLDLKMATKEKTIYKNHIDINDMIDMIVCVLENTNACMSGLNIASMSTPNNQFLAECYCYSFFGLKLENCPNEFQGSFEDDIEYRLKCYQKGLPCVQIKPLRYGKTGQDNNKDLTGCRLEYAKQGLKRGEQMSKLYGNIYSCGYAMGVKPGLKGERANRVLFKHRLKPIKCGVIVYDMETIKNKFKEIVQKYK